MNTSALVPLAVFFALLTPTAINAQEKKPQMVIAVDPVRTVDEQDYKYMAQQLTDQITRTLQRTGQFQVVSNVNANETKQERERQKTADYAGGKTAGQFIVDGADKLLVGKLTGYEKTQKDEQLKLLGNTTTTNYTYIAAVFTLELLDVATNTSISQQEFKVGSKHSNPGTAYDILMKNCSRKISNWLVKNLDHNFRILNVESWTKKDSLPKTVLINGGVNMDLQINEELQVVEIKRKEDIVLEIPVCTLYVQQVLGEGSICKVGSSLDFGKADPQRLKERLDAKADLKIWFKTEAQ
ncbi:MAG: hypothetical protein JNL43_09070 [Flavobacteriales bacterium]|nr:hypothetical protein [Flavobacteriales bacterium]